MELVKKTIKLGNSSGVILPKHWLGYDVRVIVVNKPKNIKKEALKLLENYLENISGVYLYGSYSRKEEDMASDINLLAVSSNIYKKISLDKYNILIIPANKLLEELSENLSYYLMIKESSVILNKPLLLELKKIKLKREAIQSHIIAIKKAFFNLKTSEESDNFKLVDILKQLYILDCILNHKDYKLASIFAWLSSQANQEIVNRLSFIYNLRRKNKRLVIKKPEKESLTSLFSNILEKQSTAFHKF